MMSTALRLVAIAVACLAFVGFGCGGASSPTSGTSGGDGMGLGADQGPVDEEAQKAKAFCEHQVEKSELQPPDALSRKQIMACLTAVRPILNKDCAKGIEREVVLKIIVDKSGAVSGAFPVGDGSDAPEASCVAEKVKQVTFPKFKGSTQQVIKKYPFKLDK